MKLFPRCIQEVVSAMAVAIARERHTKMICFIVKFSQGIISRWIKVLSYNRSVSSRVLFKVESIYKRSESCLGKHMETHGEVMQSYSHPLQKGPFTVWSLLFFNWDCMGATKVILVGKRRLEVCRMPSLHLFWVSK